MTRVMDLRTGEYVATYSCSPEDAVRAAFAQLDRKDFNTWDYEKRYLVVHGRRSVSCGDFCALEG